MKKQTAVSIIIENFNLLSDNDFKTWFLNSIDKLEALEKEQIIDAFGIGCHHESKRLVGYQDVAEQYYNKTFEI